MITFLGFALKAVIRNLIGKKIILMAHDGSIVEDALTKSYTDLVIFSIFYVNSVCLVLFVYQILFFQFYYQLLYVYILTIQSKLKNNDYRRLLSLVEWILIPYFIYALSLYTSHIELILAYGRNINYKMFLLQRLVNYAQT
jgi:hypothetical protein